jgi:hypothetical protein
MGNGNSRPQCIRYVAGTIGENGFTINRCSLPAERGYTSCCIHYLFSDDYNINLSKINIIDELLTMLNNKSRGGLNPHNRNQFDNYVGELRRLLFMDFTTELLVTLLRFRNHIKTDFLDNEEITIEPEVPTNAFLADSQNVHRADTVTHVNKMLALLEPIEVPSTQKTFAEIVSACDLNPNAILKLTNHYYNPVSIYGRNAIYPKTLDKVWAYINCHENKSELIERVKEELTDNIDTCSQGNLTRLCNILSGYLDGMSQAVAPPKSLQELMAEISVKEISTEEKIQLARKILEEKRVPTVEWAAWFKAFE